MYEAQVERMSPNAGYRLQRFSGDGSWTRHSVHAQMTEMQLKKLDQVNKWKKNEPRKEENFTGLSSKYDLYL